MTVTTPDAGQCSSAVVDIRKIQLQPRWIKGDATFGDDPRSDRLTLPPCMMDDARLCRTMSFCERSTRRVDCDKTSTTIVGLGTSTTLLFNFSPQ